MGSFQLYFEMIGAVAFAVSGAALGIRKGMDLFGVAMMGMTTAVCRALWPLGMGLAMLAGCGVTVVIRICAATFRWSFPKA